MKIYGKTLPEILAEMPWQFKVIVMAGAIWIPFSLIHALFVFSTLGKSIDKPGIVNFTQNPLNASVADPSIALSADGKSAFMAFTIVQRYADSKDKANGRWAPGIRLAKSRPPCKVWSDLGEITDSTQEEVINTDSISSLDPAGNWWIEQPALVHDPDDAGKEFKVYYYKYLWLGNEDLAKGMSRIYGEIDYKYTHDPELRVWSTPQPLFSAKVKTDSFHGNPPEPYNGLVQYHLDEFDASLADMWFYARPSVTLFNGVLYMTLSGFTKEGMLPDRVIMLSSPDHSQTWHFVGTLLRKEDVAKMGPYTKMGGGTLFQKAGKLYFAAVLGDDKVTGLGSFVIPVDDPAKAQLRLSKKTGAPEIINHIPRVSVQPTSLGGGYTAYTDLCKGAYISEYSGVKDNIHIFQTMKDPVEP